MLRPCWLRARARASEQVIPTVLFSRRRWRRANHSHRITSREANRPPSRGGKQPWIISRSWDIVLFIASPLASDRRVDPDRAILSVARISRPFCFPSSRSDIICRVFCAPTETGIFSRGIASGSLLAPPLVFLAALWFSWRDLHGLLFVVFTWDIWHVLMQQYGFLRIYDAKDGRVDSLGAWADRAVALELVSHIHRLSPHYSHNLFLRGYSAGLPALSAGYGQERFEPSWWR